MDTHTQKDLNKYICIPCSRNEKIQQYKYVGFLSKLITYMWLQEKYQQSHSVSRQWGWKIHMDSVNSQEYPRKLRGKRPWALLKLAVQPH